MNLKTVKKDTGLVLRIGQVMVAFGMAAALAFWIAAALAGCQTTHGQTAGQYLDDASTTTAVKSKLVGDKMVNVTRVEVETINGTVHLMGIVENPDQKLRAGRLAAQVEGVKHVDNDLQTERQ